MATNKTLTPTNVTIQIPEFTDQPDQRVNSNCIDKEADAINALNGNIANVDGSTLHYGQRIIESVDCSATGIKVVDFTEPTTPTGYTRIGYIGFGNSYRLCVMGVGGNRAYVYVGTAYNANIDIYLYPVYIKS